MKFSKNELNVICQNAAPTKAETLAGIKEIVSVTADLMTKLIMENAIRRLERIPEPECSQFIASVKAQFPTEQNNNSIRQRLAAAKAQEQILQGHDLSGKERFRPETRHMIMVEVQKQCFVGFKGERFRFYFSDLFSAFWTNNTIFINCLSTVLTKHCSILQCATLRTNP